jgi:hypothetical protein
MDQVAMPVRSVCALAAVLLACAVAPAPAAAVETGVNETMAQTVPLVDNAAGVGADWVRIWAGWDTLQPSPGGYAESAVDQYRTRIAAAHARGIKVLMIVHRSPPWASGGAGGSAPPSDPATYAAFMRGLAQRLPTVDAWEIWNEEDAPEFWSGAPEPARYAALLRATYPAIKAVAPAATVVTGGTVANDYDFVEQLYAHGAQGSFDAVGVHTDTACLTVGPDFVYREPNGRIGRYVFSGYREIHRLMEAHGDGAKQIWMTELGWNTQSTAPNSCSIGGRKGTKPLGVTEAQQAQFLTAAYRCLASDPYMGPAFWFGMQDIRGSVGAGGYGLYRLDGSAKPSAGALRALDGGIAPQRCGGVIDTSGPTIRVASPTNGKLFVDMLKIDARAVDAPGGVGIRGIEMWADGRLIRYFGDGHALIRRWGPSRHWKRGRHTITFKGIDEAGNKATRTVTVTKVRRLPRIRTALAVRVERLDARTTRVSGRLTARKAKPAGKLFVTYQRQTQRTWRTVHRIAVKASRAVAVTKQVARPGRWRVFVRYPGHKRFRKAMSKPVVFDAA